MSRNVTLTIDQLYRRQPGGIGTYVRGLALGLAALGDPELHVTGLAPRGTAPPEVTELPLRRIEAPVSINLLTRLWPRWPVGVPADADVVHATSMAGPFAGGARHAVHAVAMHDLLWRDEPGASTLAGIRFHEQRLRLISARSDLRILTSSPLLKDRLTAIGIEPSRIHPVRLGVDDDGVVAATPTVVAALLAPYGVVGPYTFYAGTREPRKNIERLVESHRRAYATNQDLGRLVLAGPSGWGEVPTGDAITLGLVPRALLKGLYRDATVFAYVPRAEGWGLPPVEALYAGTRVVASSTTPSVAGNDQVVRVDPLDVDSIAHGLVASLELATDEAAVARRRASVADLTWRNVALDHLAGWQ
jgi:glycosyltransferase involved in cell wall biosynthesis